MPNSGSASFTSGQVYSTWSVFCIALVGALWQIFVGQVGLRSVHK